MRPAFLLALCLTGLLGEPAFASEAGAEHGHSGPDWAYFAYHSIGLALLLSVLVYFTREPLKNFLLARSESIRRQIEGAEAALATARAEAAELRARLARAAQENEAFVQAAAVQAEAERVAALDRAQQAAERIRQEARRSADQEIARARRELQHEAAQLATRIAAEILQQGMTPEDDRRLLGEFVEQIGRRT
ncbi:MAG: ATP synthase F0 subunit B [Myxococcota bacterium]